MYHQNSLLFPSSSEIMLFMYFQYALLVHIQLIQHGARLMKYRYNELYKHMMDCLQRTERDYFDRVLVPLST